MGNRLKILARLSLNYSSGSGSWRLTIFELIADIAKVATTHTVKIIHRIKIDGLLRNHYGFITLG
jgi:hypothetical protein